MIRRSQITDLLSRKPPSKSYWEQIDTMEAEGRMPSVVATRVLDSEKKAKGPHPATLVARRRFQKAIPPKDRNTVRRFKYYRTGVWGAGIRPRCGVISCRKELRFSDVLFCQRCKPLAMAHYEEMLDVLRMPPVEQVDPSKYLKVWIGVNAPEHPVHVRVKEVPDGKSRKARGGTGDAPDSPGTPRGGCTGE